MSDTSHLFQRRGVHPGGEDGAGAQGIARCSMPGSSRTAAGGPRSTIRQPISILRPRSHRPMADRRADLAPLLEQAAASLRERASEKDVHIELAGSAGNVIAAIEPELAERLLDRLVGAVVVERTERGERLHLAVEQTVTHWRVSITRPAGLRNIAEAELLGAGTTFSDEREAQALSIGFALRLVRGLARNPAPIWCCPRRNSCSCFRALKSAKSILARGRRMSICERTGAGPVAQR